MDRVPRSVFLRQLRVRQLAGQPALRRRIRRLRLGALDPVCGLDHHSLLVDRSPLRRIGLRLHHAARARPPCATLAPGADHLGRLLHPVSASVHVRPPRGTRDLRRALHRAGEFRQAVQPGAVAAHRPHGGDLDPAARARSTAVALAAARMDDVDRAVGPDDVSASLHRSADRARGRIPGALGPARLRPLAAPIASPDERSGSPTIGGALHDRRICGRRHCLSWRNAAVVALAGFRAGSRRPQLRRGRRRRISKDGGRIAEHRVAWSLRAVSRRGLGELAALDSAASLTRGGGRRRVHRTHSDGGRGCILVLCRHRRPGRPPREIFYRSVPVLDLTVPSAADLRASVEAIEEGRRKGPVLVCCALGYSRSAAAVVAWLLTTERAGTVALAMDTVRRARPSMVLASEHRAALETFV
jgi:Dual specificity phosphatase, catalytic domain